MVGKGRGRVNRGERFEFRWREGEGRRSLLQAWYYLLPRPVLRCSNGATPDCATVKVRRCYSHRWTWMTFVAHPKRCC
jgi:hypothetical protein